MHSNRNDQKAFTLIELMIVIAILGILSSVATPLYVNFLKKAKFVDVINITAGYKADVRLCIQDRNDTNGCTGGTNQVRNNMVTPSGYIQSVSVLNGTITATSVAEIDNTTYILTPSYTAGSNTTDWAVSGTCISNNFCK